MTEINLLPWRETKRQQEKKNVLMMLFFSFIAAVGMVFFMNQYVSHLIVEQRYRNQMLQDEINHFNVQLTEIKNLKLLRDTFISRINMVQSLLTAQTLTVHLFDELVKVLPDGITLTSVKRIADRIHVQGFSESNSQVSLLMRNIQQSRWIHAPVLTDIKKAVDRTKVADNEFHLGFTLKSQFEPVALS